MFRFVGEVKTSDPISQIYSSLWKPWSYLTGSSEAEPAGTGDADVTTPIKGLVDCFVVFLVEMYKNHLCWVFVH